jgi:hypothetical protein
VKSSGECRNEPSGSIKCWETMEWLTTGGLSSSAQLDRDVYILSVYNHLRKQTQRRMKCMFCVKYTVFGVFLKEKTRFIHLYYCLKYELFSLILHLILQLWVLAVYNHHSQRVLLKLFCCVPYSVSLVYTGS